MRNTTTMELRTLAREEYPEGLRYIPQVPEALWVRGSLPAPGTRYLAVVGSRALSTYGREACHALIEGLRGYPVSIVSGLALGADTHAHKAALDAGLHTIAIPGSGLHDAVLYPRTNLALAHRIVENGGALLSENLPDQKPRAWDFPARNRLMVGIADAVLMIEAGEQSGTLITARLAGEYGRELLCVPHRIGDPHGYGSHLFLRLGATLVTHTLHILEALKIAPRDQSEKPDIVLHGIEQTIYDLLDEPRVRDDLIRQSALPTHEALAALATLELKGVIEESFGFWRRL
jgi:DNA processing protein